MFIVLRPGKVTREILEQAQLEPVHRMVGDHWIHVVELIAELETTVPEALATVRAPPSEGWTQA